MNNPRMELGARRNVYGVGTGVVVGRTFDTCIVELIDGSGRQFAFDRRTAELRHEILASLARSRRPG